MCIRLGFARLKKLINSLPNFPFLADEIAEPHPDINIKVAAFTVSEKSSNTQCKMFNESTEFVCSNTK